MKIEFVSKRLRYYRSYRGMTAHQLAKASTVSLSLIKKIEGEQVKTVHPLILNKIADALYIPLQELLYEFPPEEIIDKPCKTFEFIADAVALLLSISLVLSALAVIGIMIQSVLIFF
jgi:transcriptional regulator with XRE-family HTH domain